MPLRDKKLMTKKIALPLFFATVLFASVAVMSIPQASALINHYYDNSHVTARFEGEHKVCGGHMCAVGERTTWEKTVWGKQSQSQGKITSATQHGEDVMNKMSGFPVRPATLHGSEKPITHSTMPVISATKNMTSNMTSNK